MEINFRPRPGAKFGGTPAARVAPAALRVSAEGMSGGSLFGQLVFALIFFGFGGGMFWITAVLERQIFPGLITGFFAAIGAVSLFMVIRTLLDRAKYGDVTLRLPQPLPAVGGSLSAWIDLPPKAARAGRVNVDITCLRIGFRAIQDSKGRARTRRREETLWTWRAEFPVTGRRAGIRFDIPAGLPESSAGPDPGERGNVMDPPYHKWVVRVTADVPGVDLDRRYPVPVRAAESATAVTPVELPATAVTPVGLPATAATPVGLSATAAAPVAEAASAARTIPEPVGNASVAMLMLGNLPPLAGVIFWGWQVGDVVLLYWVENLIIGVMNVLRMVSCTPRLEDTTLAPSAPPRKAHVAGAKLFLAGFFIAHYGAFCVAHGAFLLFMFARDTTSGGDGILPLLGGLLTMEGLGLAILGLVVSHLFSFGYNFIGRGEYRNADLAAMMFQPYKRIVVIHVFIIAGGFVTAFSGSPALLMVGFVVLKIVMDVHFHRQEHRLLQQAEVARR